MDDMDIDIDFEGPSIDVDPPLPDIHQPAHEAPQQEVTSEEPVLNKVYLRGVDELNTEDIKAFSLEHFPAHSPTIEWIDDSSAKLCFETPEVASEAISNFTLQPDDSISTFHPLQLRMARPFSAHPIAALQVRVAVATDKKRPRAHEASRFYLMHPEQDPRENRRRGGDYRRRRYGSDSRRRRRDDDDNMYDDDTERPRAGRSTRRSSHSSLSSHGRDSYRPDRRSRARSASPSRLSRRTDRQRSPPPYSTRDPHPFNAANLGKELFPDKASNKTAALKIKKELFPSKVGGGTGGVLSGPSSSKREQPKKELFPMKTGQAFHRRTDAVDATDSTTALFHSSMTVPFSDGAGDDKYPLRSDGIEEGGFSIKGAAKTADKGFSIRGAATARPIKELFPLQLGNQGKELFAEKKRNRADMFY